MYRGEAAGVGVVSRGVWAIIDGAREGWSGVGVNCVKGWEGGITRNTVDVPLLKGNPELETSC